MPYDSSDGDPRSPPPPGVQHCPVRHTDLEHLVHNRLLLTALAVALSAAAGGTVLAQPTGPGLSDRTGELTVTGLSPVGVRPAVATTPSSLYTGSFEERSRVATGVTATLRWFDRSGHELVEDQVRSATVTDRSDVWTRHTVAGLVPARATTVLLGASFEEARAATLHTLRNAVLTQRAQGSTALVGPLRTRGTTVRDARGAVVVLRGLNRPGQWDTAAPGGLDDRDIARIKAWGGNTVRLTLGQQVWLPGCTSYDPHYPQAVDRVVRSITRRGMLAILDLHFGSPTCQSAGPNPLPDPGSVRFWTSVSRRYQANPLVAFDLWNEAYGVTAGAWRSGGTARSASGHTYQAVGMQQLYDAVRATGAQNLVLVGGLDFAATPPGDEAVRGHDLVWAVHAYTCNVPWTCQTTESHQILSRFTGIAKRMPVMISEFGHPAGGSAAGAAFNAGVIAYAEAHRWSWAAWAWDVHGTCKPAQYFNLLTATSCGTGTGTFEPNPAGVPVLVGLGRNTH
jgi:hypothetical protein